MRRRAEHENRRDGTFEPAIWGSGGTCTTDESAGGPCEILIADFTGDGYADYADHKRSTGELWIHRNLHDGTFAANGANWALGTTCVEDGVTGCQILVGDFDGDGLADFGARSAVDGDLYVRRNSGASPIVTESTDPVMETAPICAGVDDCEILGHRK